MPGQQPHLEQYWNRLPHWRLEGSAYFLTWRLKEGRAPLREPERQVVADAISHFYPERYRLFAYVVMDDHVHAILSPSPGIELGAILHSLKSFSALKINRIRGEQGALWQKASFDRIIRDEEELEEKMQYVLGNPRKRWPGLTEYPWAKWFKIP